MRKFSAIIGAMLALFLGAVPAQADHDQDYYYDQGSHRASTWLGGVTRNYCIDKFEGPLTNGEYSNMVNSTINRINSIESATDITTNWALAGPECSSSLDYSDWAGNCIGLANTYPNVRSRITYEPLLDPDVAEQFDCDLDDNGKTDFFWIVIDSSTTRDYHWDVGGLPPNGAWDYAGLLTHEMVHATGFNGHFPSTSDACTQSVGLFNTMCNNTNLGVFNGGNSNGTWWRTLESHDIGEINQAY